MFDTYLILKNLICCHTTCSIPVNYITDMNATKNAGVFVPSTLFNTPSATVDVVLRGYPNKGTNIYTIASELKNLNNTLSYVTIDDVTYSLETMVGEFVFDGVDDQQRISYSTRIKLALYRKDTKI